MELYPPLPALARENRAFLIKAAGWAAGQGIEQFIDLGAGLPASPSVHHAVRAVLPAARAAYVDTDSVVVAHATALLATGDGVTAVNADLRDPAAVLGHHDLRAVINPARPVCVILGAILHFLDPDAACAVTAGYISLMAPGSCLVISCARFDDEALAKQLAEEYTAAAWHNHSQPNTPLPYGQLDATGWPSSLQSHKRPRSGASTAADQRLRTPAVGVSRAAA